MKSKKAALAKSTTERAKLVRAKKGQLLFKYGRDGGGDIGTVVAWGEGCARADGHLLNDAMTSKRCTPNIFKPKMRFSILDYFDYEPSFVEELEKRGYDIKTIEFSIQKKTP